MYFIRKYIKNIFREKKFFLIIFFIFLVLFTLVGSGLTIYNVLSTNNQYVTSNQTDYDYYLNYASRTSETTNKYSISPLKLIENNEDEYSSTSGKKYSISTSIINSDYVFDEEKVTDQLSNNKFNILDYYSKESIDVDLLSSTKYITEYNQYVYDYYQANGENSDAIELIKNNIFNSENYKNFEISLKIENGKISFDFSNILGEDKALNKIGAICNAVVYKNGIKTDNTISVFLIGKSVYYLDKKVTTDGDISSTDITASSFGGYSISSLYESTWFNDSSSYLNKDLFIYYMNKISSKYNFDISYLNSFIYSNNSQNQKILFIDRGDDKYNALNLNIENKYIHYTDNATSVIVSSEYARRNKLELGSAYEISDANIKNKFQIDGFGYDYNNAYPLIYDSDVIPNTKNEVELYCSTKLFKDTTKIKNQYIVDNSKLLFKYNGNNIKNDYNKLVNDLTMDCTDLESTVSLKTFNSITDILRKNSLSYFSKFYLILFVVIFIIFSIISILTIIVMINGDIKRKIRQIGILKANGLSSWLISMEYLIRSLIPILISSIVSIIFIYVVQIFTFSEVNLFFNIKNNINLFSVYEFIVFVVAIVAFSLTPLFIAQRKISIRTVLLMENRESEKVSFHRVNKFIDRINIKSYSTRFSLKQFFLVLPRMSKIILVMFFSSIITSLMIFTPWEINNFKNTYYKLENFNLENKYYSGEINNPMSWYTSYSDDNQESKTSLIFDAYKKNNESEEIQPTALKDFNNSGDIDYIYNDIGLNFISLRSKKFSISDLHELINLVGKKTNVDGIITSIIKNVLPSLLDTDVEIASTDQWEDALSKIISQYLPAEVSSYWNDSDVKDKYSVDFLTTKKTSDDYLGMYVDGSYNNTDLSLKGISDSNFYNVNLNKIKNKNDVIISKKLAIKQKLKVNDSIDYKMSLKKMSYCNKNNEYIPIETSQWLYKEDDGSYSELQNKDLSKIIVGDNYGLPYYNISNDDNNPIYIPYSKLENVVLKIPKNQINASSWDFSSTNYSNLFDQNNDGIVDGDNEYYYIHPYDWKYSKDGKTITDFSKLLSYIKSMSREPNSWFDIASSLKNSSGKLFIKDVNVTKVLKLNVVSIENIFDSDDILINNDNLHNLVGVSNSYFNYKISKDSNNYDVYRRLGITSIFGNVSSTGLKNMKSSSSTQNFISIKQQIFDISYDFTIYISALFIVFILVIALISISILSRMFINTFMNMIYTYKVIGYSNREINKIINMIYMPIIISVVLVSVFSINVIYLLLFKYLIINIVVIPYFFNAWSSVIVSLIVIAFYLSVYYANYNKFISKNIQEQIATMDS